jgi:hypothetical protein
VSSYPIHVDRQQHVMGLRWSAVLRSITITLASVDPVVNMTDTRASWVNMPATWHIMKTRASASCLVDVSHERKRFQ